MIEIKNENKAKFLALHLGNDIKIPDGTIQQLSGVSYHPGKSVNKLWWFYFGEEKHMDLLIEYGILLLKPISSITDEDVINIARLYGWTEQLEEIWEERILQFKIDLPCIAKDSYKHRHLHFVFDYLRSRGYALPWMGLSVEQMVEAGWIKLKGSKNES